MLQKVFFIICLSTLVLNCESAPAAPAKQELISFSKDVNDELVAAIKKCAGELKLDDIFKTHAAGEHVNDEAYARMVHCTYNDTGYGRADGSIDVHKSSNIFPDPPAVAQAIRDCDKGEGKTPMENIFIFYKCFQKRSPYLVQLKHT